MDAKEFGKFITQLREEKQLTQSQLAALLHVTGQAVSRWERGLGFPDISTLEPLAEALGVSLAELMKCKRIEQEEIQKQDADEVIAAGLEIAALQRKLRRKNLTGAALIGGAGILILLAALWGYLQGISITLPVVPVDDPSLSVIGGADGPTSIFLAGRIGTPHVAILGGAGALLIAVSVWKLLGRK